MKDKYELKAYKGEYNYLQKLKKTDGGNSKTFILKSSHAHIDRGYNNNELFVKPKGGPVLQTKEYLKETGATIRLITFIPKYGYIITFY